MDNVKICNLFIKSLRHIKNIEDIMDSSYGDIYNMGKNLKVPYIDEIKEKYEKSME